MSYVENFHAALSLAGLHEYVKTLEWCHCSSVAFEVNGKWMPIYVAIRFGRGKKLEIRDVRKFNKLQMSDMLLSPKDALSWLEEGALTGFGGRDFWWNGSGQWECTLPTKSWLPYYPSRIPCYIFYQEGFCPEGASQDHRHIFSILGQEIQSASIFGPGEEQFRCVVDAVDWWARRTVSVARKEGSLTKPLVEVYIPLPAGHISALVEEGGSLTAHVEGASTLKDISVNLAFRDQGSFYFKDSAVLEGCARFPVVPQEPFQLLVRQGGHVYSCFKGDPWSIQRSHSDEESPMHIQELIANGEREGVEFKELGNELDGKMNFDILKHKVPRVMSAMANTSGGTILLGVSDSGGIVGVGKYAGELAAKFSCSTDQVVKEIEAYLKIRVAEHYKSVPVWRCSKWSPSGGQEIMVFHVEKNAFRTISEMVPNEVLVRKGSSVRQATTEDLIRLIEESDSRSSGEIPWPYRSKE